MGLPKTNWRMGLLVDEVDMSYVLCVCIQVPTTMDHLSNFLVPSYDSTQEAKMAFLFFFVFSDGGNAFLVAACTIANNVVLFLFAWIFTTTFGYKPSYKEDSCPTPYGDVVSHHKLDGVEREANWTAQVDGVKDQVMRPAYRTFR